MLSFSVLQSNAAHPFADAPAGQELNILQSEERQEEVCEVSCSAVSQVALWPVGEEKGNLLLAYYSEISYSYWASCSKSGLVFKSSLHTSAETFSSCV